MNWFEDWFDSPLYELVYADRNEEEARKMVGLIELEIPVDSYPAILDMGCGRGRHSITLAKRGYRVTGLDLSEEAIRRANEKVLKADLPNLTFLTGDMRKPLDDTFDAIVNLFTTFGYFLKDEENLKVMTGANHMLRSGGRFLIDYLSADYVKENLVPEETGSYGKMKYRIRRKIEKGMVYKKIRFSGGSLIGTVEYVERVKLYRPGWFENAFEKNGFQLLNTFGNYSGAAYLGSESPRLIMIAEK